MAIEINRLNARLADLGIKDMADLHPFPGTEPATKEQLAAELNKALTALENGDFDLPNFDDDD